MSDYMEIGKPIWTIDEIKAAIPEFVQLYESKPLAHNSGGMAAPHMFGTWFMLRKLKPDTVIESGVWKGQGTWLIENALPNAKIYSIDIDLGLREYISDKVTYFSKDFGSIDWSIIEEKDKTVIFFDDHQNGFNRISQAKALGFKTFIFEDNYSGNKGDCYSLKKAFEGVGHNPDTSGHSVVLKIKNFFLGIKQEKIAPNTEDAKYLKETLGLYYEFPPVLIKEKTRWGEDWSRYPTKPPVYTSVETPNLEVFSREATDYTWICLAQVK